MKYLIDTNILSEITKPQHDQKIKQWLKSTHPNFLSISVITIGEIRKGIEKLPQSSKKEKIKDWLEHDILQWFSGRIIPIDIRISEEWGNLCARIKRPLPVIDSLIAATALTFNLKIATKNRKDFKDTGVEIITF